VKSPSAFQTLSPCRSSTRVRMSRSLREHGEILLGSSLSEVYASAASLPEASRDHQRPHIATRAARNR
jgi:hypothetical protein